MPEDVRIVAPQRVHIPTCACGVGSCVDGAAVDVDADSVDAAATGRNPGAYRSARFHSARRKSAAGRQAEGGGVWLGLQHGWMTLSSSSRRWAARRGSASHRKRSARSVAAAASRADRWYMSDRREHADADRGVGLPVSARRAISSADCASRWAATASTITPRSNIPDLRPGFFFYRKGGRVGHGGRAPRR